MRERTISTYFDFLPVFFLILRVPGTVFKPVERAVTKQTVYLLCSLMTRIIFTFFILKKSIRIIHIQTQKNTLKILPHFRLSKCHNFLQKFILKACICRLFSQNFQQIRYWKDNTDEENPSNGSHHL